MLDRTTKIFILSLKIGQNFTAPNKDQHFRRVFCDVLTLETPAVKDGEDLKEQICTLYREALKSPINDKYIYAIILCYKQLEWIKRAYRPFLPTSDDDLLLERFAMMALERSFEEARIKSLRIQSRVDPRKGRKDTQT